MSAAGGANVRWRPDGKQLFYIAPDGKLMAVPVELQPDKEDVVLGTPAALFTPSLIGNIGISGFAQQYIVSRDGERFLIATVDKVEAPIQIIRNWQPKP